MNKHTLGILKAISPSFNLFPKKLTHGLQIICFQRCFDCTEGFYMNDKVKCCRRTAWETPSKHLLLGGPGQSNSLVQSRDHESKGVYVIPHLTYDPSIVQSSGQLMWNIKCSPNVVLSVSNAVKFLWIEIHIIDICFFYLSFCISQLPLQFLLVLCNSSLCLHILFSSID